MIQKEYLEEEKEGIIDLSLVAGKRGGYLATKRFLDIVLSIFALIVLSPVFAITAIAILIEDGRPVIFSQERNGLKGNHFKMFKFRSMIHGAESMQSSLLKYNEADGPVFKLHNDPRVTRVGRFIRKTSIDELPQLVNIIKGEMSIVGPRPLPVYEMDKCTEWQRQRLLVKPGLTCYWQINGRNTVPFDEWMKMDMAYIRDASLAVDTKIIFKTFGAVLSGKGAF